MKIQEKKQKVVALFSRPSKNVKLVRRSRALAAKKCTKKRDARAKLLFCQFKLIASLPFSLTSTSLLRKLPNGQFFFPVPSNSPRSLCDSLLGPVFLS